MKNNIYSKELKGGRMFFKKLLGIFFKKIPKMYENIDFFVGKVFSESQKWTKINVQKWNIQNTLCEI